mgnify:CR=1 FL=1
MDELSNKPWDFLEFHAAREVSVVAYRCRKCNKCIYKTYKVMPIQFVNELIETHAFG